jgi:hypothetical protein
MAQIKSKGLQHRRGFFDLGLLLCPPPSSHILAVCIQCEVLVGGTSDVHVLKAKAKCIIMMLLFFLHTPGYIT